jgi:5-aminolevulinate synthase
MSNLQVIARRCPIMGKALAVQAAKNGKVPVGGAAAIGAIRTLSGKSNFSKAELHTSRFCGARALESSVLVNDKGMARIVLDETKMLKIHRSPLHPSC